MGIDVFYSWQDDRPAKINRRFIREALDVAVTKLPECAQLTEPVRIDSDTSGVPGTPPIAATVFRKIDTAAVFVADVTFVGKADDKPKLMPNSNVLGELGYAAARLGWDRIILVSNTAFGSRDELPFDLRHHRFPTAFKLAADASDAELRRVHEKLASKLAEYIAAALTMRLFAAEEALASLDHYAIELIRGRWNEEHWGVNMTFGSLSTTNGIDLAVGRILELRLARCEFLPGRPNPLYRWTYLGREVIRLLRELSPVRNDRGPKEPR